MKIAKMKKTDLVNFAEEKGIKLPGKATVPAIRETILAFTDKENEAELSEESKDNALDNAKRAKALAKDKKGRAAMASVYDSFRSLLPKGRDKLVLDSVSIDFWKARPDATEFAGCTVRQNEKNPKGFERALLNTIHKAFKDAGFDTITPVIRKGGSGAIHF